MATVINVKEGVPVGPTPRWLPLLPHCLVHLTEKARLLGPRGHPQPDEIVVVGVQPGVGEQPSGVRVEVHEGPGASVEDAGTLLDEPAEGAQ
jgi:hypothetical protein